MTGRELIEKIVTTITNLDDEIPLVIYHRDIHDCVIYTQQIHNLRMINGILRIEADSIGDKQPF
jgi:hypothetical protein